LFRNAVLFFKLAPVHRPPVSKVRTDPILAIPAKLLVPSGKPAANAPKYFAAVAIAERAADSEWLSQATKALAKHWQRKNQRRQLTAGYFL
jgi:hypothetical protein